MANLSLKEALQNERCEQGGFCPTDLSPKETELKCGLNAPSGKTGGLAVPAGLDAAGREVCHDTYRTIIFISDAV